MTHSDPPESAHARDVTPQPIAVVRSYDALRAAIAAWCQAEHITRMELDAKAGLTDGHSGKLLSPRAVKKLGNRTFGPVLSATGLALIVVRDNEALALIEQQINASEIASVASKHWRRNKGPAWARRMNGHRALKLTAEQRSTIARKAAQARWQRRSAEGNSTASDTQK